MASADAAASEALGKMLSSDKTGPLYEALVAKGLASDVSVDYFGLRMASPYFALASVPKEKDPDAAEAAIVETFEKKIGSLTAADLERAKSVIDRDYDRSLNDSATLASLLSEHEAAGSWKLLLVQRELTKSLTLDAVKAFAAKYLRIENRVVGRFIPDSAATVVTPEKEPDVDSYKDLLAKVPAASRSVKGFSYAPASLQASLVWTNVGPAKVGLLAKEIKGDDVHLRLWIPFAGVAAVNPVLASGEALGSLMVQRTRSMDKAAFAQKMGELKSKIDASVGLEGATISIRCKKERLGEVAAIAKELLRTPFIEEQQLREHVTQTEGRLKSMKDNPPMLLQGEVSRMLFPEGDPRRSRTVDQSLEELKGLKLEGILAFHKSFFGADGMLASVIGEVTPDEVQRALSPLVEGWKSEKPFRNEPSRAVESVTTPAIKVLTPGKPSAFSVLLQPIRLEGKSPEAVALDAAAWALFQDPLGSRISKKIREDAALSYATGGQLVTNTSGDLGAILLFTVTKPENAPKAIGLIKSEIEGALRQGITAEELEAYKKSYQNQKTTLRANDQLIAAMIVELKKGDLDFTLWSKQDEEAAALTLDQVNAALRKYVQPAKTGLIEIGDFKE
jgi:zinc protease